MRQGRGFHPTLAAAKRRKSRSFVAVDVDSDAFVDDDDEEEKSKLDVSISTWLGPSWRRVCNSVESALEGNRSNPFVRSRRAGEKVFAVVKLFDCLDVVLTAVLLLQQQGNTIVVKVVAAVGATTTTAAPKPTNFLWSNNGVILFSHVKKRLYFFGR